MSRLVPRRLRSRQYANKEETPPAESGPVILAQVTQPSERTLCALCNGLEKKDPSDRRLARELIAEECLRVEKSQECQACLMVVSALRAFEQGSWTIEKDVSRLYLYGLSSRGDSLTVEVYFRTDKPKLVLEIYYTGGKFTYFSVAVRCSDRCIESEPPYEAIRKRAPVEGYPVLTNGVQWAQSCLKDCKKHASCSAHKRPTSLPIRLLCFKRLGDTDEDIFVQLCEDQDGTVPYIALSHCWGLSQMYVTTAETIEDDKVGIPWNKLSATFRDAIKFALALDIHYIWIDSLCIIQNDIMDWELHSSRMADVYQNAYLTLAATAASSGSEGCYSLNRMPSQERTLETKFGAVVAREKIKHWETPSTKASAALFPLLTRGWALQERYLSPRTLHFGGKELIWECLEDLTCECGSILADCDPLERLIPDPNDGRFARSMSRMRHRLSRLARADSDSSGSRNSGPSVTKWTEPDARKAGQAPTPLLPPPSYEKAVSQPQRLAHVSDQWHDIVEQYTSLKLTRPTDRLPALSGLAVRAASTLGVYYCGLWYGTIASDLLWRVSLLEQGAGRPKDSTSPTWSWASVNAPVAYWNDLDNDNDADADEDIERLRYQSYTLETWGERRDAKEALTRRLQARAAARKPPPDLKASCNVVLKGSNPFGEVEIGTLEVTGFLCLARLGYTYHYETEPSGVAKAVHDPLRYTLTISMGVGKPSYKTKIVDLDPVTAAPDSGIELPFFADYILSEGPEQVSEGELISVFLLRQDVCLVLTGGPEVYRRIGIVRQSSGYRALYGLNWMAHAAMMTITIV